MPNFYRLAIMSIYIQDIKISFEYVDLYAKMLLILDTGIRNSTTQQPIIFICLKQSGNAEPTCDTFFSLPYPAALYTFISAILKMEFVGLPICQFDLI